MQNNRHNPHIRQRLVVAQQLSANSRHEVAAVKAELSLGILRLQRLHKVRRM